jgi:hypothetical protein
MKFWPTQPNGEFWYITQIAANLMEQIKVTSVSTLTFPMTGSFTFRSPHRLHALNTPVFQLLGAEKQQE